MHTPALAIFLLVVMPVSHAQKSLDEQIKLGRSKSQNCTRCHGRYGMKTLSQASNWQGDVTSFVIAGLTAFRDKTRIHAIMNDMAKGLSDEDIQQIAIYFNSLTDS